MASWKVSFCSQGPLPLPCCAASSAVLMVIVLLALTPLPRRGSDDIWLLSSEACRKEGSESLHLLRETPANGCFATGATKLFARTLLLLPREKKESHMVVVVVAVGTTHY